MALTGLVLFLALASVVLQPTRGAHAESLPSFEADYQVQADGTVIVEERVSWDFTGTTDRHRVNSETAQTEPDCRQ